MFQFDDILVRDQTSKSKIKRTIAARDRHIELVRFERKGYMERQNRAQNDPKNYCSIVIDGADQAAFGLPHFVYDTKDTVGHKLKVKLVGLKEHGHIPKICLYLMTEEFATGTNHVVETIHRWLNEKSKHGPLPPTLYIQLDNSGRENKNRYQIAYLECLVAWGVFKNIEVSFLPVGHTHEDIDQVFSRTSEHLRRNNARTMSEMAACLRNSYTPRPSVYELDAIINWSGLCDQSKCLYPTAALDKFSQKRYYKINEDAKNISGTSVMVKQTLSNEWGPLALRTTSVLKSLPVLANTPPTITKNLKNENEVMRCFRSCKDRIPEEHLRAELQNLIVKVYTNRSISFHWELRHCVEQKCAENRNNAENSSDDDEYPDEPVFDLEYEANDMIACRGQAGRRDELWVAQVESVEYNNDHVANILAVKWYEICSQVPKGREIEGQYKPSLFANGKPWRDRIPVDSVLVNFRNLNRKGTIPGKVHRSIMDSLGARKMHD